MFKVKSLILLMGLLVSGTNVEQNNYNQILRTDDYVHLIRQQYAVNIQNFGIRMDQFKRNYATTLDTINRQTKLLIGSLGRTENKLNSLEVLSPQGEQSVNKYRSSLPTNSGIQENMTECLNLSSNKLSNLLLNPLNTSYSLQNYYKNIFEIEVVNCKRSYNALPLNYTNCVIKVVSDADKYTIANQKIFFNQMNVAQCSADANINQSLDCSYLTATHTITDLAEINILVNQCIDDKDICDIAYMYRSQISATSQDMYNPFYRRYSVKDCLMLKILN